MLNFIVGLVIGAFLSSPVLALVHSAIIAFEPLIQQFGQLLINA